MAPEVLIWQCDAGPYMNVRLVKVDASDQDLYRRKPYQLRRSTLRGAEVELVELTREELAELAGAIVKEVMGT